MKRTKGTSNKKANVLITGVTSTIGRMLAQQLYFDKRVGVIIGVSKHDRPYYFNEYSSSRFIYIKANILKYRELNNLFISPIFKNANINTVVHLAFVEEVTRKDLDPHTLNVEGTKQLLDMCLRDGNIKKFVFKSTIYVYKLKPNGPVLIDENADLNLDPDAPQWIKDRVDADMLCRGAMENDRMKVVVLRFPHIIGRNINSQMNIYLNMLVPFKVMGYDPIINLIHARDVVNALQHAVHQDVKGVFNIRGKETGSLSTFLRLNKKRPIPVPGPIFAMINAIQWRIGTTDFYYPINKDVLRYSCVPSGEKMEKVFGFKPMNHVKFG